MPSHACGSCVSMDTADGLIEDEYDFAEDALDFEEQLAKIQDVQFTQMLSKPLVVGSHIVFTGTPTLDIPWFALNLGCGDPAQPRADIALHLNVRCPQRYAVRNTKRHGRWGSEETTSFRKFPFEFDRRFTIELLIAEGETLIAVDGRHYCAYAGRAPGPLAAGWLQALGVRDAQLSVGAAQRYPAHAPPPPAMVMTKADPKLQPQWEPHCTLALPDGVREYHQLVITGKLRPILHSFRIDLLQSPHEWPAAHVYLHVNVRAYDQSHMPRQLVVLNAWFGSWGAERRQRTARLVPGAQATFRIVRGMREWSVYADDVLLGEMEIRGAVEQAAAMRVRGDFYPTSIHIEPMDGTLTAGGVADAKVQKKRSIKF